MKKKALLSSILTIALCLSLIAGSTFALFTSESKVNVAVTSGKVDVVATIENLQTYSMGNATEENGVFENNGTAFFKNNNSALVLDKVTPGDKATFSVKIVNNSNVAASYRIKMYVDGELASALIATATIDEEIHTLSNIENVTTWTKFDGNETVTVPMSVELPIATGNEYQSKSANVTVVVEAIQGNGAGAILVNNKSYSTFEEALIVAGANGTIQISGTVEVTAVDGTSQVTDLSGVTIEGLDYATLVFVNYPGNTVSGTGTFSNMTLKNLTVVDETYYIAENGENAWEFTYLEFGGNNTFENVVFSDGVMVEGGNSTFKDCKFIGHNNDSSTYGDVTMYGAWVYSGKATFTGCTFTGTRGLKVHQQYEGADVEAVLVDGCIFEDLSEKPGVVIGTVNENEVTIKNSQFIGTQAGDAATDPAKGVPYIYETDSKAAKLENNQVTTVTNVATEAELTAAIAKNTAGVSIRLTEDITLSSDWTPISFGFYGTYQNIQSLTIDGNGHTISGLTSALVEKVSANRTLIIKDLTVKDADISNSSYTNGMGNGILVGYVENGSVTLDNCHVADSSVTESRVATAALIGYIANTSAPNATINITDCTVKNTVVNGDSAAGFVGYAQQANITVSGCEVSGSTFTGEKAEKQGAYFGTVNGGTTANISNTTADTTALVGRILSGGAVNYN